ncbi:MAG TPA: hypothetical protein VHB21_09795, partial [Minicystis sp.]|nr:hypothetical protein [Minicystis sp.]
TGGASGTGGSTGAAGGDPCPEAHISIDFLGGDPPPPGDDLAYGCPNGWGSNETSHAVAYDGYVGPGPNSQHELFMRGCDANGSHEIDVQVPLFAPGSSATDAFTYTLPGTTEQTDHGVTVTVTSYGPSDGYIEGSYTGHVQVANITQPVQGQFKLCHVASFLPP